MLKIATSNQPMGLLIVPLDKLGIFLNISCYFISVSSVIHVASVTILNSLQYFLTRYDLLHNAHLKLEGLDELYRVAKVHHTPGSLQHK